METACQVVEFHLTELGRIVAIAGETELAQAGKRVVAWLKEELLVARDVGQAQHIDEHGHAALTRLVNDRARSGPLRDPEFRARLINALEREHFVAEVKGRRGR